jgi:hypothetical protein
VLDDVVAAGADLEVAAPADAVELELLLLPQAAASADTPSAMSITKARRPKLLALITTVVSLSTCQNPGTLAESWQ